MESKKSYFSFFFFFCGPSVKWLVLETSHVTGSENYIKVDTMLSFPFQLDSIRNTVETNLGGLPFMRGRQYTSQLLVDQDVPRVDYTPGYYRRRLSPTTTHIPPLSQPGSSAHYSQNRLPSPYRPQNRLPSPHRPYYSAEISQMNRLPLPSPHLSQDRGRGYVDVSLPQGGPRSGKVSYGDANLSISSYYSSAAARLRYR